MKRLLLLAVSTALLITVAQAKSLQPGKGYPSDTIARVGDELITYAQLSTRLNSSAVVGVSVPVLGSEERKTIMLALLDKTISADLLYQDAISQGLDKDPEYRQAMDTFADAIIGELYRKEYLVGRIEVTEAEMDAYFNKTFSADTELSDRLRNSIEATLRKQKFLQRSAQNPQQLRESIEVLIIPARLDPADDAKREAGTVVAEFGDRRITWGEVKGRLTTLNNSINTGQRVKVLQDYVDRLLMARKGREAGLDKDPGFQKRLAEFRKTRLLNMHRGNLVERMEPSDDELHDFYQANKERIAIKERRRIQMLVLPDSVKAEYVKQRIETGKITFHEAVLTHSIAPNAKQNLGDFGWVARGSGFPALDELTFSLELDQVGGPVESPAGWHLVKVLDLREASLMNFEDEATRKATRRMMIKERMNDYVVWLRKQGIPVVVYEDNINRLFREEAQWIAAKTREMEANPERARLILDEMRALVE